MSAGSPRSSFGEHCALTILCSFHRYTPTLDRLIGNIRQPWMAALSGATWLRQWLAITMPWEHDAARRPGCASARAGRVGRRRTRRQLTSRPHLVMSDWARGRDFRDEGKHWKHTSSPFGIRVASLCLDSPRSGRSHHRRRLRDVVRVHESATASPVQDLPYRPADHLPARHRLLGAGDHFVPVVYEAVQLLVNSNARVASMAALIRHVSPSQTSGSIYGKQALSRFGGPRIRHFVLIATRRVRGGLVAQCRLAINSKMASELQSQTVLRSSDRGAAQHRARRVRKG